MGSDREISRRLQFEAAARRKMKGNMWDGEIRKEVKRNVLEA